MTSLTSPALKTASRKQIRQSIREFASQMSEAPVAKAAPIFALDAETARKWELVKNA